jgi:hypothetical protein
MITGTAISSQLRAMPGRERLGWGFDGHQDAKHEPKGDDRRDDRRHAPVDGPCIRIADVGEPRCREPRPEELPERKHIEPPQENAGNDRCGELRLFVGALEPEGDRGIADEPHSRQAEGAKTSETDERPYMRRFRYVSREPLSDAT